MVLVVGVSGGSCSGKTGLCKRLAELLGGRVAVVHQDDYCAGLGDVPLERAGDVNFDHVESVDFQRLQQDLRTLQGGAGTLVPQYDFTLHRRKGQEHWVDPAPVILVDGHLLFVPPAFPYDLRIFMDASLETRYTRRLQRDVEERGRTEEYAKRQFNRWVSPMHEMFVEPFKATAHLVLSGERDPEEAARLALTRVLALSNTPLPS